jgi:hypothetical protein
VRKTKYKKGKTYLKRKSKEKTLRIPLQAAVDYVLSDECGKWANNEIQAHRPGEK